MRMNRWAGIACLSSMLLMAPKGAAADVVLDWNAAGCGSTGGGFSHWGNVTPFGIKSADQFRLGPPPALSSGRYRHDFIEVQS